MRSSAMWCFPVATRRWRCRRCWPPFPAGHARDRRRQRLDRRHRRVARRVGARSVSEPRRLRRRRAAGVVAAAAPTGRRARRRRLARPGRPPRLADAVRGRRGDARRRAAPARPRRGVWPWHARRRQRGDRRAAAPPAALPVHDIAPIRVCAPARPCSRSAARPALRLPAGAAAQGRGRGLADRRGGRRLPTRARRRPLEGVRLACAARCAPPATSAGCCMSCPATVLVVRQGAGAGPRQDPAGPPRQPATRPPTWRPPPCSTPWTPHCGTPGRDRSSP